MTKSKGIRRKYYEAEVWKVEVAFEKYCKATLHYKTYRKYTATVYDFLKLYPKKVRPDDFYACDVEDWAVIRQRRLSKATVDADVNIIRYFFNWIIRHGYPELPNPASFRRRPKVVFRPPCYVTIEELQSLHSFATGRDTEILLHTAQGETPVQIGQSLGMSPSLVRSRYRKLCTVANFGLSQRELGPAIARLYLRIGEVAVLNALQLTPQLVQDHSAS